MATITNHGRNTRMVNVRVGKDRVKQVAIAAGASIDGDLIGTAGTKAAVGAGLLSVDAKKAEPKKSDE